MDTGVKYTTKNLVEFEAAMDLDVAIVSTLLTKVKNKSLLSPKILNANVLNMNVIRNLLLYRTDENPLSVVLDEKYKDSFDTILQEIKDKYYDYILDVVTPTDILGLVHSLSIAKDIIFSTILCETEKEAECIRRFTDKVDIKVGDAKVSDYNCIFIKYINRIDKYFPIAGKYIYIYNAQFNLDERFAPKPMAILLSEKNVIRMVDPYKHLTVPTINLEGLLNERRKSVKKKSSI